MYSKILVAVDRSPIAEKVFETASYLGKNLQAQLNFVNVLSSELIDHTIGMTSFSLGNEIEILEQLQEESEKLKQESLETLQYWVKKAKKEGINAIYTQLYGNPAKAICEQAKEWDTDLIVMGRRGHSTFSELFLGSVSSSVIHRCECSVHLVQF